MSVIRKAMCLIICLVVMLIALAFGSTQGLRLFGAFTSVSASSTIVTTNADSGAGSLRQAAIDAPDGGTITFSPSVTGTIILTSGEIGIAKNLTIQGPGASVLTISGNNNSRVFEIGSGNSIISGLTITGGMVPTGQVGGGIKVNDGSTLTVNFCVITGNSAGLGGGGFRVDSGGTLNLNDSTVSNNNAKDSTAYGGGVQTDGTLNIARSTLSNNTSDRGGAIVPGPGANVSITNSTIGGNSANDGGGIFNFLGGITITNSTISGNSAPIGAAIDTQGVATHLVSCTVTKNSGAQAILGSGYPGTFTIRIGNSIVAGQTTGNDIETTDPASIISEGYNIVGAGAAGFTDGVNGDQVGVDPKLAPLGNNGGPTRTHALLPNSPAIDKGNSFGLTTDQRGSTRPSDQNDFIYPNAAGGDGSDIGAFEFPSSFIVTRSDDRNSLCVPNDCSLREAVTAAASGDTITFAPGLSSISLGNEILINKNLTINGPGSIVFLIDAHLHSRLFHTSGATVTISGMTLLHGNGAGSGVSGRGGAIYNDAGGILNVTACIFTGNHSIDSGGTIFSESGTVFVTNTDIDGNSSSNSGGAISVASGTLNVNSSTISNNGAVSGGGGIESTGILASTINVTNSTISGNSVSSGSAGGVFVGGNPTATFISDTITNNSGGSAGGLNASAGTVSVRNSIIAANQNNGSVPDVAGTFSTSSFDLIGNVGTAAGFTGSTNLKGTFGAAFDPGLRPLGNNGGPTRTHSLRAISAAIDRGNSFGLTTDQRGLPRPVDLNDAGFPNAAGGDASDIGAYELQLQTTPITVSRLDDRNGFCLENDCSLREAITQANSIGGNVTINFSVTGTITIGSDLPAINVNTTINGPGVSQLTVSGNNSFRQFVIDSGFTASISGLTIANGLSIANGFNDATGGCINSSGTLNLSNSVITNCKVQNGGNSLGGGISNFGNLTVTNCTFSNNTAGFSGGAIANSGTITVSNSTFNGNTASQGGAVRTAGALTMTNCTFNGNSADSAGALDVHGSSSLINCTISGNTANTVDAGIAITFANTLTLTSTIVSGNTTNGSPDDIRDLGGVVSTSSFNLIGTTQNTGLTNGVNGNIVGVNDPKLGPLANNGGPTQTMALLPNSPAIDKGNSSGSTTDQRGSVRPVDFIAIPNAVGGDGSDIGAFESLVLQTSPFMVTRNDDRNNLCLPLDCSLREAINTAASGDTITFAAGLSSITLSNEILINKNLTINGPGSTVLLINANLNSRLFHTSGATVTISGMTLFHGNGAGSGISGRGGALYNDGGGTLNVTACDITGNHSGDSGGAIYSFSGTVTVTNTDIDGNSSSNSGGGISINSGTLNVNGSTISNNLATFGGGGIDDASAFSSTVNVTNSTISGNGVTSGSAGGVFMNGNPTATFTSTTITNNSGGSAGGLNASAGTVSVRNSIIAANQNNGSVPDVAGTFSTSSFDLIGNVGTAAGFTGSTNLKGTFGAAFDPGLRPLGNNGGPTRTHSLRAISAAIDRGNSFGLTTDQRGLPRPVDLNDAGFPNAAGGDASDIGAYELQLQTTPITVSRLDERNSFCLENDCSLREAITQANASGGGTINFSVTGTITIGSDLPAINVNTTINGPGVSQLTVSGNNSFRPFNIASGTTSISGLTLANGSTNGNGGCINSGGTLNLSNSVITNCKAPGSGFGGGLSASGKVTITNCTFSNNSSATAGGAVSLSTAGQTVTISNSTFSGNSLTNVGGAIYVGPGSGAITMTNCTVSGNSAVAAAGAIEDDGNIISLINCTVSGNSSGLSGGGIRVVTGTITLTSTIVSSNHALSSFNDLTAIGTGRFDSTSSFNLIGIGGGLTNSVNGNIVGVNDPKLGPLANNGGPTQTMALLTGSPAIDRGKSSGLTTDQRGFTRPVQQDHIVYPIAAGGDGSDIGAFESGTLPTIDSLSPTSGPELISASITVSGANFLSTSLVRFNGVDRGTNFVNSTTLTVDIPSGLIFGGPFTVAVINPGPISSNTVLFTVDPFNVCGSQTTSVDPGNSGTASVRPGGCAVNGVDGTLNRDGGAGSSATIYAASYTGNPTGSAILDVGGGFVDLKVTTGVGGDTVNGLFYYPNAITGTNETNLHLLYFDGTKWQAVKSSGGVDPVKNTADNQNGTTSGGTFAVTFDGTSIPAVTQLTGTVFTFSTFVPTAVEFDSATVTSIGNGNLIEWKTGFEVNNLGFNVYRQTDGERVKITLSMVAGTALMVGGGVRVEAGNGYAWFDNTADSNASYWLEDVDLDGSSIWHGPFGVTQSRASNSKANSGLLSALNLSKQDAAATEREYPAGLMAASSSTVSTKAITSGRTPSRPSALPSSQAKQWSIAAQPALKIAINKSGWYHLNALDLMAAGLDSSINPSTLQMFVGGIEIPIKVIAKNSGLLSADDSIEFYGSAIDTPTSDTQIYWLVSGSGGKRIGTVQSPGAANNNGPASFLYTVERKDRSLYFSSLRNGDAENWFGSVVNSTPVSETLNIRHLDRNSVSQAEVEIALQGVTTNSHQVNVMLNGSAIESISFDGMTRKTVKLSIPQSSLTEGSNQITLAAQGAGDVSLIDYIRITYAHAYAADSNYLFASVEMQPMQIGGFTSNQITAMDVTNPNQPVEIEGTIAGDTGNYSVSIGPAKRRNLMVFTPDQMLQPVSITANQPSTLNKAGNGADYLIITHKDLVSNIQPFAAFKQSQGYDVRVVDVDSIYDEFSYGVHTPQALKDFLNWTYLHWSRQPQYVLLAGSGSLDPKNYTGLGNNDLAPVKLIDTSSMETASDDWFVDFNNDGLPQMSIGRLPVRTAAEATTVVNKIIKYEQSGHTSAMVLVSDISDNADFNTPNSQIKSIAPANLPVVNIVRGQTGTDPKTELMSQLSQGERILNYAGHGSVNLWRGNLLTSSDAQLLTDQKPSPLLVTMTCLNGYFQDPKLASLGESLLKVKGGGAVSVWASSAMTDTGNQQALNQEFFRQLFGDSSMTIGQAIRVAKAATPDNDVRRSWILFGDPTMTIKR